MNNKKKAGPQPIADRGLIRRQRSVSLSDYEYQKAKEIGDHNASRGIQKLLREVM